MRPTHHDTFPTHTMNTPEQPTTPPALTLGPIDAKTPKPWTIARSIRIFGEWGDKPRTLEAVRLTAEGPGDTEDFICHVGDDPRFSDLTEDERQEAMDRASEIMADLYERIETRMSGDRQVFAEEAHDDAHQAAWRQAANDDALGL